MKLADLSANFDFSSAKSADFSANFDFSLAKIPRNWSIFPQILTFFPRKSHEIDRFFREFAPKNPATFCFFFREISEALKETSFVRKFDSRTLIG